jgi:hypothetical protein
MLIWYEGVIWIQLAEDGDHCCLVPEQKSFKQLNYDVVLYDHILAL